MPHASQHVSRYKLWPPSEPRGAATCFGRLLSREAPSEPGGCCGCCRTSPRPRGGGGGSWGQGARLGRRAAGSRPGAAAQRAGEAGRRLPAAHPLAHGSLQHRAARPARCFSEKLFRVHQTVRTASDEISSCTHCTGRAQAAYWFLYQELSETQSTLLRRCC